MNTEYIMTRQYFSSLGTGGLIVGLGIEKPIYVAEDPVREPVGGCPVGKSLPAWVAEWKIKGKTAIPYGRYQLAWTPSTRFKRSTIQLLNVPGYDGIRVHAGNDAEDTEGCLLPGLLRQPSKIKVLQSVKAVKYLEDIIVPKLLKNEKLFITIAKGSP